MPPRVRITREEIISAALSLVREGGESALGARRIAERLSASTQPIFSNFPTMKELFLAVHSEAQKIYDGYIEREVAEGKYPPYKASGMAYIRFAGEERELFKLLYMRERRGEELPNEVGQFRKMEKMAHGASGVPEERAGLFHLEMWAFVHGIAVMRATGFLELAEELISEMLTDAYKGVVKRYETEKK